MPLYGNGMNRQTVTDQGSPSISSGRGHHRPASFAHTYSIVARCRRSGMLGMATTSSSVAVASRCMFVRAGVGAIATQNLTDPRLGLLGLDLLARGYSAPPAVRELVRAGLYPEYRQIACVDSDGQSAVWTGNRALPRYAELAADDVAIAGNSLSDERVVAMMAEKFSAMSSHHLASRLLAAIRAGFDAGGEAGHGERSAGLIVCDRESYPVIDLRIDWDEVNPVAALENLWARFSPQMTTFLDWAKRPTEFDPG